MRKNQWKKAYRIKRRKPILKNRIFQLAVLAVVFFSGIFYLVGFLPYLQVKEVKVSGNQKVPAQDLISASETGIAKNFLSLKSRSIILACPDKINRTILENYPLIKEVTVKKDLPDSLLITVKERSPAAILAWGDGYYYIDEEGIAFEKIPGKDQKNLEIINQASSLEVKLGQEALGGDLLSRILKIKNEFNKDLQLPLEKAVVVSEQRLDIKTTEGWTAYFNLKGDMDWQLTELKAVLEIKIPPQKRRNLQYIDLRFDKVFVFPQME